MTDVTVGVLPIVDVLPLYAGIQEGIFAKHGLTITPSVAQGGAALIPSVLQGSVPIAFSNSISYMIAYNKGLPVEYLASAAYSQDPARTSPVEHPAVILATAPNSPIKSVTQLAGKTISINALKGIQELAVRAVIDAGGGDSSKVNFLALPLQQAQGALESGRVDAISINEPFTTSALAAGDQVIAHPLNDLKIAAADYGNYLTSKSYAQAHPEIVKSFVEAITEATSWVRDHETDARKVLLTYTNLSAQDAQTISLPYYETDAGVASLHELASLAVKYGILSKPIDVDTMLGGAATLQQ